MYLVRTAVYIFQATERSTDSSPLLFGVETVLSPRAAKKSGKRYPGGRRRCGPLHDEMAQGRGGEDLATPHSKGRQERRQGKTAGTRGGGAAVLIQLSTNAETKW